MQRGVSVLIGSETALDFQDITKHYAGKLALAGVSLAVPAGQATGLLGVNGAGKSTLIRAALDLIAIDSGEITIFGADHRNPAARRDLAYLAERFVPPHYSTGRELLSCLCALHGIAFDAQAARAECAALEFDPAELGRRARDYSRGMAQKLGLIACLLARRRLLMLDEPMNGLDPQAHALFRKRLLACKAEGATLFFSTHTLADVTAVCDQVIVMHGGELRFSGTTAAFRASAAGENLEQAFLALLGPRSSSAARCR